MYPHSLLCSPSDSISSPPSPTVSSPTGTPSSPTLLCFESTAPLSQYLALSSLLRQLPHKNSSLVHSLLALFPADCTFSKRTEGHEEWKERSEEKRYLQRRNLGQCIVSAWRVQLGEVGRGTVKRLISERLHSGSSAMRDAARSISRIKAATIEQLIVISSVVGCLRQAVEIACRYEERRGKGIKLPRPGDESPRSSTTADEDESCANHPEAVGSAVEGARAAANRVKWRHMFESYWTMQGRRRSGAGAVGRGIQVSWQAGGGNTKGRLIGRGGGVKKGCRKEISGSAGRNISCQRACNGGDVSFRTSFCFVRRRRKRRRGGGGPSRCSRDPKVANKMQRGQTEEGGLCSAAEGRSSSRERRLSVGSGHRGHSLDDRAEEEEEEEMEEDVGMQGAKRQLQEEAVVDGGETALGVGVCALVTNGGNKRTCYDGGDGKNQGMLDVAIPTAEARGGRVRKETMEIGEMVHSMEGTVQEALKIKKKMCDEQQANKVEEVSSKNVCGVETAGVSGGRSGRSGGGVRRSLYYVRGNKGGGRSTRIITSSDEEEQNHHHHHQRSRPSQAPPAGYQGGRKHGEATNEEGRGEGPPAMKECNDGEQLSLDGVPCAAPEYCYYYYMDEHHNVCVISPTVELWKEGTHDCTSSSSSGRSSVGSSGSTFGRSSVGSNGGNGSGGSGGGGSGGGSGSGGGGSSSIARSSRSCGSSDNELVSDERRVKTVGREASKWGGDGGVACDVLFSFNLCDEIGGGAEMDGAHHRSGPALCVGRHSV
eukprot:GHVS01041179.1.p1 GENE.GHVS01041179.1~~GHVS01041179.1.p1  ORF type:complete len:767 (+),score=217.81 GHVS01041179.1:85-2385(+)